jgi:hypothetical protein
MVVKKMVQVRRKIILSFIRVIQICNYIVIHCETSLISPCLRIVLALNNVDIYTMIDYVHKSNWSFNLVVILGL